MFDDLKKSAARWVSDSDDDVSISDMGEALEKAGVALQKQSPSTLARPTHDTPRALFHDPYSIMDWGGWRERPSSLTYESLRQMAAQTTPITAIIQLRINQISQFCKPQQGDYDRGYRVQLRDRRNNRSMTAAETRQATELERMLETTGYLLPGERGAHRDSFRSFVKKSLRDTLTFDQWVFEKQRDAHGRPSRFICLDGASIRPAVSDVEHMNPDQHRERVSHVQIFEETIVAEFTQDDLAWCVMNPRSDLRVNGFGLSPVEQIVRLVTAWLFGFQYNQKFFCISGDSLIHTDRGLVPLEDLVGTSFKVWDGERWEPAEAVETGHRELCRTEFKNGLLLETSPLHLFRGIPLDSPTGEMEWIRQHDLRPGDFIAIDTRRADPPLDMEALHVGRVYLSDRSTGNDFTPSEAMVKDPEFWELMGFALGDGHVRRNLLQVFPHYERDAELFSKFRGVLGRHGIQVQDGTVRGGANTYPCLKVFHTSFIQWLRDIGFRLSSEGKRIPPTLFGQPAFIRDALLRGIFSADGHTRNHVTGYRTPTVCAVDDALRRDITKALLSVGVAATAMGAHEVRVQDIEAFVSHVGYLQPYKNERIERSNRTRHKWDLIHPSASANLVEQVRTHARWLELPIDIRRNFYSAALGTGVVSRPRLVEAFSLLGETLPEVLNTPMATVTSVSATGIEIPMFDVIVHNDRHLFFANGAAVHNTQGSAIKGLINIKGAIPDKQMRAFRRMWYTMVSGVGNAWRTPILNSEEIQWLSMHSTNREMEFAAWMDWLTKLICAVYGVDPLEINFQFGNTGQSASIGGQGSQEEKLSASRDKGLIPLVDHLTDHINRHIIEELCPDFEFTFAGLDAKAEEAERKARMDESAAFKTVNEVRAEMRLPALPGKAGDMIRDAQWVAWNKEEGEQPGDPMAGDDDDIFGDDPDDDLMGAGDPEPEPEEDDDLLELSWRNDLRKADSLLADVFSTLATVKESD